MYRLVVGGALLVCSFSACSGSTDAPSSQSGHPQTAAELPGSFAAALCESAARCCREQGHDSAVDECKTALSARFEREFDDYQGLRVVFDADAAARCIDGWANVYCPERVGSDPKRSCNHLFVGQQALGEPCEQEEECAPSQDGSWPACSFGKCVAVDDYVPPAQDEPCGGTCQSDLADPVACEAFAFEPSDRPLADPDAPLCATLDGLQCWTSEDGSSTCQPLVQVGESCTGNSHSCEPSAFCNLETGQCEARHDSGACDPDASWCSIDAPCDPTALECVPRLKIPGESCEKGAECDGGICGPTGKCRPVTTSESCAMVISLP